MNFFTSPTEFSKYIEEIVRDTKLTYMEAVLKYCSDNFLEPDDIKKMLSKPLIEKIKNDMVDENMIPKPDSMDFE